MMIQQRHIIAVAGQLAVFIVIILHPDTERFTLSAEAEGADKCKWYIYKYKNRIEHKLFPEGEPGLIL